MTQDMRNTAANLLMLAATYAGRAEREDADVWDFVSACMDQAATVLIERADAKEGVWRIEDARQAELAA